MNGLRKLTLLVGAAALLLSGCASPSARPSVDAHSSSVSSEWLDARGVELEYEQDLKAVPYSLPTGVAYPTSMYDKVKHVEGHAFQAGIGRNQVWFTWLCAWERAYLHARDAHDDKARELAALNIERWPTMTFYRTVVDDPGRIWVKRTVMPLRRGDARGVAAEYRGMCGEYPTVAS